MTRAVSGKRPTLLPSRHSRHASSATHRTESLTSPETAMKERSIAITKGIATVGEMRESVALPHTASGTLAARHVCPYSTTTWSRDHAPWDVRVSLWPGMAATGASPGRKRSFLDVELGLGHDITERIADFLLPRRPDQPPRVSSRRVSRDTRPGGSEANPWLGRHSLSTPSISQERRQPRVPATNAGSPNSPLRGSVTSVKVETALSRHTLSAIRKLSWPRCDGEATVFHEYLGPNRHEVTRTGNQ
jgi:hypothetical protein